MKKEEPEDIIDNAHIDVHVMETINETQESMEMVSDHWEVLHHEY